MTSCIIPPEPPLSPTFEAHTTPYETISTQTIIDTLKLTKHPEGGYYTELDRDPRTVPNPFQNHPYATTAQAPLSGDNAVRNASTSILYLLTPHSPQGHFHRNAGRTVHTLIQGRGRYVLIHADEGEAGARKRVETFVVGRDVEAGERVVWIVEGGKYKASFLLAEDGVDEWESRLLISEVSGGVCREGLG
ncbi:RmlC-like cupin domain-containing protein [Boeremia exigua]|uniref:RmlC-like cupin domain-containing protein n=1 Tax=Boeremia exigua TaxID=749465 RepID=UPI001E8EAE3F|nr:RmlC-like cupin domain-containing protein [Boeremia exigua]KAH6629103.1 RmlC-like cupin domain-containing protein [Boeremia exigua]